MELVELATPENDPLRTGLIDAVKTFDAERPRSMQKTIGPSSAGEPCTRKLAYQLMGEPKGPGSSDPWAAIVGTAVHEWLAQALLAENVRVGYTKWLVEQSLAIRDGMRGSCDAYEVPTGRVVDHKVPGSTKFKEYTKQGPSTLYRKQAHLYGYGYQRLGLPVTDVCLAFYPRAGRLYDLHVWSEKYDESIALEALDRVAKVTEVTVALEVNDHPENYRLIPMLPGDSCRYCPWFQPGPDTGITCPGEMGET